MKGRTAAVLALAAVVVISLAAYFAVPPILTGPVARSCSGGEYGVSVKVIGSYLGSTLGNLTYTKDGVLSTGLYYGYTAGALAWLEKDAPANATVMSWWDYGKEIIGCTGRNAVISNPSSEAIAIGSTANVSTRDPNQKVSDVALALFATNSSVTASIMGKYGAGYLFISAEDGGMKAPYILQLANLTSKGYVTASGDVFNSGDWTSLGEQTVIYRILDGQSVSGLSLVYSDAYVRILQLS